MIFGMNFKRIWISNRLANGLFETNLDKTLESYWQALLPIL